MSDHVSQKYEFKAEVKQLLDILVHSLYTSREIFLRELISNASDALDKLRFESTRGSEIADSDLPQEIRIEFDEKARTLTVADTGIGMTHDELITNIGTIAKSGSADFVRMLKDNQQDAGNIIGKFGVGFYSVFMVADKVRILSRSFKKDEKAVEWLSDGLGDYEISEADGSVKRGTRIEIHLKESASEFAEKYRLESIIKKHSNFISFPIYLAGDKINTVNAIWREPKSSVTKEQYDEFYKFLTYDNEPPMDVIHKSVDAPIQFNSLLFIPKKNTEYFWVDRENYGLDLYVRRVLIQHKNKDLLPEYLSFVKGVVDSEDLPLNISRETLQENVVFSKISSSVTTQVLNHLIEKAKSQPDEYIEFWKQHGKIFKLGYGDFNNTEKYMELVRFNSSADENSDGLTSMADYVARMKPDQKEIYFVYGNSREAVESDPHLEIFKSKGLEAFYLYDPVDEFIFNSLRKYKEFDLVSVESADLNKVEKFEDSQKEEKKPEEMESGDKKHFSSLLEKMKKILGDRVVEVKESRRLKGSASCLVNPDDGLTSSMQKILKMTNKDMAPQKKIMEINPNHKLIRNMIELFKQDSNDAFIADATEQLYESALLQEGVLEDPHTLINRMNKILENSSGWYLHTKK